MDKYKICFQILYIITYKLCPIIFDKIILTFLSDYFFGIIDLEYCCINILFFMLNIPTCHRFHLNFFLKLDM